VVERASGKSFSAFLQAEVFDPLGMKHTFVRDPRKPAVKGQAVGYTPGLGLFPSWMSRSANAELLLALGARGAGLGKALPWKDLAAPTDLLLVGEAGVWSCVEDLARLENELRRPTLVRRASLERAWTPGKLDDGKPIPYGQGWFVANTPFGREVSHTGRWPGFTTCFLRYPERDLAVA